jgi:hypothetical protein
MDNRAPEGSTWDQRLPALELARPSDDGFDLGLTGSDEEEPGRMLAHGDAVGGGDPAGGGRRRARRAGARDGRRSVPLMAKQAGARGRATDAAMPGRGGRAGRRRGRVGGKPFDRACRDRGHVLSPGDLRRTAVGDGFERCIVARAEHGTRQVVRFDGYDPVRMREWRTKDEMDAGLARATELVALAEGEASAWGHGGRIPGAARDDTGRGLFPR